MGLFKIKPGDYLATGAQQPTPVIKGESFAQFSPDILGLGDVGKASVPMDALCAIFDLAGFTKFCNQVDPHLVVPEFLSIFLKWFFDGIKAMSALPIDGLNRAISILATNGPPFGTSAEVLSRLSTVPLYFPLPFFAKFMGDGVLLLWEASKSNEYANFNIIIQTLKLCRSYRDKLLPKIRLAVADPPEYLRCGITRGRVLSVGNGEDYVGPCINIASRLQKLGSMMFCVSRRGFTFDVDKHVSAAAKRIFLIKAVSIRGIGERELVYVLKEDFEALPFKERKIFRDP